MKTARIALATAGLLAMGYAVLGALTDPGERLIGNIAFLAAVLILHDGLFLPVLIALGLVARRLTPGPARTVAQGALIVSVAVAIIALPLVSGVGRAADNPSALPLAYGKGLLIVLAVVWLVAAAIIARRLRAGQRRPPTDP